jgi:hypothetical protein
MSPLQWIQVIAALASALAAGLVWALRRPSSLPSELLAAKEAELAALRGELDALRELAPIKIREFFLTTRRHLRDYCALLQRTYDDARRELARCDADLAKRQGEGSWDAGATRALVLRREELAAAVQNLRGGLRELQHQCEYPDNIIVKLPAVNPASVAYLTALCLELGAPGEALSPLTAALTEAFKYRLDENTLFSNQHFIRPVDEAGRAEVWQRPDNGE